MKKYFKISQFFLAIIVVIFFTQSFLYADIKSGSFIYDGRTRYYEVHLPHNYHSKMPLVINIHGNDEDIEFIKTYTEMHFSADTMEYVLVYPQGINDSWNAGIIIPGRDFPDTDDAGFIAALIDTMKSKYDIDLSRVYACGFSLGGMLSFRLAGEYSHRFAAVASVAGPLFGLADTWVPVRPIPVLQMHGTADIVNKYEGEGDRWPAQDMINYWIKKNSCLLSADIDSLTDLVPEDNCTIEKISYLDCADESVVIHYKINNGGHSWPGSNPDITWSTEGNVNRDINANVEIWNFFKNYTNPLVNLAFGKWKEASYSIDTETLTVTAGLSNPENHSVSVKAFIQGDQSAFSDSLHLYDDGLHHDGEADDNLFGGLKNLSGLDEDLYKVTLRTMDLDSDISTNIFYPSCFTTIGPVVFDTLTFSGSDTTFIPGESHNIYITLKNFGSTATATDLYVRLISLDSLLTVPDYARSLDDIAPGETATTNLFFRIKVSDNCPIPYEFPILIQITSNGQLFWTDTFSIPIVTAISDRKEKIPVDFALYQNYPNPLNPKTVTRYALPVTCHLDLSIYNILGQKVATLVNKKQPAGNYSVEWNASGFASGVYLYHLQAGDHVQTKKMILLK